MSSAKKNKIILFGGKSKSNYSNVFEYNTSTHKWKELVEDSLYGRTSHSMAYLQNNKIIIFGGHDGENILGDTIEFDLNSNKWNVIYTHNDIKKQLKRTSHSIAYVKETNKIIMFGGYYNNSLHDTWIYDINNKKWIENKKSGYPNNLNRKEYAMSYIGDGKVIMFGGNSLKNFLGDTWIYYIENETLGPETP